LWKRGGILRLGFDGGIFGREICVLEVDGVSASINGIGIITDASLSVGEREFCGLVGRNGAGKTTLLRTIMGQVELQGGEIKVDGTDLRRITRWGRAALGIGYMPENRGLVPELSVWENVMVPAWSNKIGKPAERMEVIYRYIPELEKLTRRRATQLSGGQQKLVALGRALMAGRKLVLLDEPTEGVAPVLARRLIEVLQGIRELGVSALIAESNETSIIAAVDRLYEIERGAVSEGSE